MKNYLPYLFLLAVVTAGPVFGQAPASPATNAPPARSVFVVPTNAREGRDPFFPESTRVFQTAEPSSSKTVDFSSLEYKGFYRDAKGALAIINNHTFAVGEEGDVITSSGGRVHIRCLEIHSNAVVIEINGERHELNISTQ